MLNLIIENLAMLVPAAKAAAVSFDPTSALYSLLAGTYGGAAHAAAANDHHSLCRCYVLSAALHGLIGLVHSFGG